MTQDDEDWERELEDFWYWNEPFREEEIEDQLKLFGRD
jgi:hypothetical protein